MTQPAQSNADFTIGGTGFNPHGTSQLTFSDLWKNAGMTEGEAEVYLVDLAATPTRVNIVSNCNSFVTRHH